MNRNTPLLEVSNLRVAFDGKEVVRGIDFTVQPGEKLALVGESGSGKTVTALSLLRLVMHARITGTAGFLGRDLLALPESDLRGIRGSDIAMIFQEPMTALNPLFTVGEQIAEVLELTNATWMQDRYVESLSHGMQQRVGIARTLLHNPEVLILDEPANGLDPEARIEMRTILLRLAAEGRTLIVTSHILPELARICDRIAIVAGGKLRAVGTLQEVTRELSQRRTVEIQFLNSSTIAAAAERVRPMLEQDAEITVSETESIIRCRTSASDEKLTELLRHLVYAGDMVSQFREVAGDLEEAFVSAARVAEAERTEKASAKTAATEVVR